MINYILHVILFQVLFLAIYDFFLSKETFFTKNRWYLLCTPILSFIIPLIKIPSFQKAVSQDFVIQLPEIILSPEKVIQNTIAPQNLETSINYITLLFWMGVVVFLTLFLLKLLKIINLIRENEAIKKSHFKLILLPQQTKAFSFFNYIFLGKEIAANQQEKVIAHELVHSKQKHSLDLLFFEVLKIAMWFNPMIYFYQKRITLVHEYISDAVVAKSESKETYINNLLSNFFQVEHIAFVNQFYKKSMLKQRVIMMTKNKSKQMNQFKYLAVIPVLMSMLFYSSCSVTKGKLEKRTITYYRIADGKLFSYKGDKESYLDSYFGADPKDHLEEIPFEELPEKIKEKEYAKIKSFKEKFKNSPELHKLFKYTRFFKAPDGRIAEGTIGERFKSIHPNKVGDELLFIKLNKMPIFPGCAERDSDCFIEKIDQHFKDNFDTSILAVLKLKTKKIKVNADFTIDTNGYVKDITIKAPHEIIGNEAKKAIASLPKMTGGEKYGKPIKAHYKLPFTILID